MAELSNRALAEKMKDAAVTAVSEAGANPAASELSEAVADDAGTKVAVRRGMGNAIADDPFLAHLTSSENPLQSRAVWSAVVGLVGNIVLPWAIRFGWDIDQADIDSTGALVVSTIQGVSTLWAIYLALRARYASKPLFSGWLGRQDS